MVEIAQAGPEDWALVRDVRLRARAEGAGRTPYLHVTQGNDGARALYVSCGFAPTGVWAPLRDGSPLRIEELVLRRG